MPANDCYESENVGWEEQFVNDYNVTPTRKQLLSCPAAMIAPRNQWYIAALSQEVTRGMLSRQILEDHIVFFRTADGSPVALAAARGDLRLRS